MLRAMKNRQVLDVAIVGAGYFGRFHALQAARHEREQLVGLYDPDQIRALTVAQEVGAAVFRTYESLLERCKAVIIASPAETHHRLARQALEAGCHVLVEKPLASTEEEGEELVRCASRQRRVLQVGHLLRYSAEHAAIRSRIKHPLYIEATRIAPYKTRGTDVSVVLDLMIHDLDFILSLVDSPILDIDAMGATVSSPSEDIANARVRFENGCVASITASRISFKTERKMRLFAQEGYLSADFVGRKLVFINRETGLTLPEANGFRRESVHWKEHDNLAAEHDAFVASCLDGKRIVVDGRAGLRALEAALLVGRKIKAAQEMIRRSGLID
ncbi:oxidoreductase [Bombella sp. TMW2.1889]|uniref:Oxidoreductase n=1 Tax=Bombella mellum TaxID=2039288 RepID=A0ABR5ZRR1_9PROT|nr:oxidoreductase [Bombella mellum]